MTLEERVAALEQQVGMESGLRAAADRDLSDLAVNTRASRLLIDALHLTQSQHTRQLEDVRKTQVEHYAEHKADAAELKAGISQIVVMLETLIAREGGEDPR